MSSLIGTFRSGGAARLGLLSSLGHAPNNATLLEHESPSRATKDHVNTAESSYRGIQQGIASDLVRERIQLHVEHSPNTTTKTLLLLWIYMI